MLSIGWKTAHGNSQLKDFLEFKRRIKRSIAIGLGRWRPAGLGLDGNRMRVGPGGQRLKLIALAFFHRNARNNLIVCGRNVRVKRLTIQMHGRGNRLEIGDNANLSGMISIYGDGVIVRIGDNFDAKGCKLVAWDADVTIGADCLFADAIELRSGDIHAIFDAASGQRLNPPAPIALGDRVWVGSYASLLKGTAIPADSVVATRAVVTKTFDQPGVVLAGAPARVVRTGVCWKR